MWYFTWILGVLLACSFGIINVIWYEFQSSSFDNEGNDVDDQ
ncbi:MAG: cytochrome bd-I oxidase subunit CydX [Endozoicomonadaceae bacterium]|nr:cytochrome bd-I oxidase subunit CydX [Endozoicomonadaceae bacterium]